MQEEQIDIMVVGGRVVLGIAGRQVTQRQEPGTVSQFASNRLVILVTLKTVSQTLLGKQGTAKALTNFRNGKCEVKSWPNNGKNMPHTNTSCQSN